VSGVVTSADDGETLIGVTVKVNGTNNGTVTDYNGRYSLTIRQGERLTFTYIGYREFSAVPKGGTLNVSMQTDNTSLDEVVVVGYGQVKRITMTYAPKRFAYWHVLQLNHTKSFISEKNRSMYCQSFRVVGVEIKVHEDAE